MLSNKSEDEWENETDSDDDAELLTEKMDKLLKKSKSFWSELQPENNTHEAPKEVVKTANQIEL